MRRARFSIISFERRHAVAGLIIKDLFRGVDVWLVDEGLESSLSEGAALATRLYHPEGFAMTAGVLVPLDIELIEDAIADTPQLLGNRREGLIDDRRFAEAIYRVALASGSMGRSLTRIRFPRRDDVGAPYDKRVPCGSTWKSSLGKKPGATN
jgi:hypothetical protein